MQERPKIQLLYDTQDLEFSWVPRDEAEGGVLI